MAFLSHGEYLFSIEGNLLIIEGYGPWNLEAIINSSDDSEDMHKKLYGTRWGVLAIIHGDPIHTPDAAELLADLVKKDKKMEGLLLH